MKKRCSRCKKLFLTIAFGEDSRVPSGLQSRCRKCCAREKIGSYHNMSRTQKDQLFKRIVRYRQRKVNQGICAYCTRPIVKGTQACKRHLHRRRNQMKRRTARLRKRGLCIRCGLRNRLVPFRFCRRCRIAAVEANRQLREEVIRAYGSKCRCCGESGLLFLSIDHVFNDGAEHRRRLKTGQAAGRSVYLWLKKRKFPRRRFQVLCMNCNYAKRLNGGRCPHETDQNTHPRPTWGR